MTSRHDTLRVATFNCGNADPKHTADDLDRIGADAYGLQETGDRHPVIDSWCRRREFEQVPFDHGTGDTPVLYDPRKLVLLDHHAYPVMDRETYVGPEGAGPTVIHVKYVTHARFRLHRRRRTLHLLNNHVVASWARDDLPEEEEELRRDLGRDHLDLLVGRLNRLRATAVTTGDFNAEKAFPPMRRLTDVVDLGNTGPTCDDRTIDFVGVKGARGAKVRRRVVAGTSSDHNPVVATITLD